MAIVYHIFLFFSHKVVVLLMERQTRNFLLITERHFNKIYKLFGDGMILWHCFIKKTVQLLKDIPSLLLVPTFCSIHSSFHLHLTASVCLLFGQANCCCLCGSSSLLSPFNITVQSSFLGLILRIPRWLNGDTVSILASGRSLGVGNQ